MPLAVLYDIHGNLPALEAVLRELRRIPVEGIVVGGDVLPGPLPRETLSCLLDLDLPVRFLHGNGDRVTLAVRRGEPIDEVPEAHREGVRWGAQQLEPAHEAVLASWPATLRLLVEGVGEVLFCHATPRSDREIVTRLTPEEQLLPLVADVGADLVVCGHTHMPFDRRVGTTRVVNAGSVGMSFAGPGAFWLLLGPGVELRHTSYDLEAAAAHIRRSAHPQAGDFAERSVLHPPTEAEMLAAFAPAEVR